MERLRYLDNYRLICERRLRDLAPSHPLPVLPSHCGRPNPEVEELRVRLKMQQQMLEESAQANNAMEAIRLQEMHQSVV